MSSIQRLVAREHVETAMEQIGLSADEIDDDYVAPSMGGRGCLAIKGRHDYDLTMFLIKMTKLWAELSEKDIDPGFDPEWYARVIRDRTDPFTFVFLNVAVQK